MLHLPQRPGESVDARSGGPCFRSAPRFQTRRAGSRNPDLSESSVTHSRGDLHQKVVVAGVDPSRSRAGRARTTKPARVAISVRVSTRGQTIDNEERELRPPAHRMM